MYFIYNNVSSKEFGIKVKKGGINNFSSPQRSYETVQVKGRNGDLIIDTVINHVKDNNIEVNFREKKRSKIIIDGDSRYRYF